MWRSRETKMVPTAVSDYQVMGPRLTDAVLEGTHSPLRRETNTLWDAILDTKHK